MGQTCAELGGGSQAGETGAQCGPSGTGNGVDDDGDGVVSAIWDASLLSSADGSAVEVRVVGPRSGGNPSNRRTVEVE